MLRTIWILKGISTSVQSNVEVPEVYIIACCRSNDNQVMYGELRMEDVITLSSEKFVVDGIEITEKLRFFKGNILLTTNERNLLFTRFMKNVR